MTTNCFACGKPMTDILSDDYYDQCKKSFEIFIIAGEQKPPEQEGKYVFWIHPDTKEPMRPRMERKCEQCGFSHDVYHWVPGGEPT